MRLFLSSLALFLAIIATQARAQPKPADSTDIIWQVPTDGITGIRISPDSKYVATDCRGEAPQGYPLTVRIWDIKDGSLVKEFSGETSVNYSKIGSILLTRKNNSIILRENGTWNIIKIIETNGLGSGFDFSPDNNFIANAAYDKGVQIFDVNLGKLVKTIIDFPFINDPKFGGSPKANQVSFSNDNNQILFSGDWTFLYDISQDSILKTFDGTLPKYSSDNIHFANKYINYSQGSHYYALDFYDITTTKKKWSLDMGQNNFDFCFSPDGKEMIISSEGPDLGLFIWSVEQQKQVYRYKNYDEIRGYGYGTISPNSKYISALTAGILYLFGTKNIVGIDENNTKSATTLYPNPSTGFIKIDFILQKSENIIFSISDNSGHKIKSIELGLLEAGNNSYSYNTSSLSTGIYYITLQSTTFAQTYKLVKE